MVIDDDADVADLEREHFSTNDVAGEHLEGKGECSMSRVNDNVKPSGINDGVDVEQTDYENDTRVERKERLLLIILTV